MNKGTGKTLYHLGVIIDPDGINNLVSYSGLAISRAHNAVFGLLTKDNNRQLGHRLPRLDNAMRGG